ESQFALPLANSNDHFLVSCTASALAMRPTADIGFIHLDHAAEFGFVDFGHRCADSMAEIPCCLVGLDSKRTLNLAGGHALFRFTEQHGSEEPRHKGKMCVVEDS